MMRFLGALMCLMLFSVTASAQAQGPLRIEITEGVIEPLPFAVPDFVAETPDAAPFAREIARVVADDLTGTGLFREVPASAHISQVTDFAAPVAYADWRAINAQALVTGSVAMSGSQLTVQFRAYDIFSGGVLGVGKKLTVDQTGLRRVGHKIADAVYARITGEGPYFDTRVAFVSESGPKNDRRKRLAIMDYDGANVTYVTDSAAIVLAPRFSPDGRQLLYTSYESGFPQIHVVDLNQNRRQALAARDGTMSFAPRYAPDGLSIVFSLTQGGNTDLFSQQLATGARTQLTNAPSIETAPSFSPDGRQIVFESDRSGTQQLYIMLASGGEARRISYGQGRYGTPVWSPRGDLIAFTKQNAGRFHIGVMRTDGSEERLLTASFLDESPTWAPNGRVIMFSRETRGEAGRTALYSVDITGRNLRPVRTPEGASDPAWSPLLD